MDLVTHLGLIHESPSSLEMQLCSACPSRTRGSLSGRQGEDPDSLAHRDLQAPQNGAGSAPDRLGGARGGLEEPLAYTK